VELLTHGVDIELFSSRALAAHSAVADLPAPRFGYIGLIDERSDLELMADVAAAMPDCTFVFVGPSAVDAGKCFAHLTNVHLVGPIPYRELPAVMQGLDVLFLPYRINDLTATISPLKLKEYLASGKPVVASPLPEVKPYEGAVSLARDAAGWIAALRAALTRRQLTPDEARMLPGLAGESWDEKVTRFLRLVGEQGNK
jgi:glycosyltransferase involved in cell wall biosynthesis